ncbi:MAG: type II toxin-antitoxin system HicA family toxin [Dehalococcoidia bacterium]|nr:type II toxin-antitoxin system HicA family toxin [Dehalococcoidia bacterium]MDW8119839.1 type II toxin-antitoxin system HicA family toxin [Chloroflexota bacterium]
MTKFPVGAPRQKVVKALERLGFRVVRIGEHIAMVGENPDGTRTPLPRPDHPHIKASPLQSLCRQAGVSRADSLRAYREV